MTDESIIRNTPQQDRSRQRLNAILKATESLLTEVGYEGITTSAVAKRAGTSVGSVYKFFSDKDALLNGLAHAYLDEMQAALAEIFVPDALQEPLEKIIERTMTGIYGYAQAHPAFHHIFGGAWVSAEIATTIQAMNDKIRAYIEGLLALRAPHISAIRRKAAAHLALYLIMGITQFAHEEDLQLREAILREIHQVGHLYLQSLTDSA